MGHPLSPDLSKLTNEELSNKFNDLMSRYNAAFRMGKTDIIGQLQMLIQDYQNESDNRQRKMMEELEKNSKSFKKIIDIK